MPFLESIIHRKWGDRERFIDNPKPSNFKLWVINPETGQKTMEESLCIGKSYELANMGDSRMVLIIKGSDIAWVQVHEQCKIDGESDSRVVTL